MLIKIVKQPVFNSFSLIADRLNAEFNKLKDVYSISIDFTHKSLGKSDFTILIQAFDVLLNYNIDKERDGTIVCMDISDTDMVGEKVADVLNKNCDVIITPSNWSQFGLVRGGVTAPIYVVPNPISLVKPVQHERNVGIYLSMNSEQFHRKGSDIALDVISKLDLPWIVKQYSPFVEVKFSKPVKQVGLIENIEDYLKQISAFVMLSRGGAFEMPAWEAYCSGAIPIVTSHPIFSELPAVFIKSRYTYILLPPHLAPLHIGGGYEPDINDAIDKIKYVWSNPDKFSYLFKRREQLCEHMSPANVAKTMLQTLTSYSP